MKQEDKKKRMDLIRCTALPLPQVRDSVFSPVSVWVYGAVRNVMTISEHIPMD